MDKEARIELLKEVIGLVEDIGDDALTDWEKSFVSDYTEKLAQYNDTTKVSDKQLAILERIKAKF